MNLEKYLFWVWLNEIRGIGPITASRLLAVFSTPENIYIADKSQLLEVNGIGVKTVEAIFSCKDLDNAKRILDKCYKLHINICIYNEQKFPQGISKIKDCPILLYYRGKLSNENGIAIGGSRRCTEYGKRVTVEVATFLAKNGITVISGMAKGIDSYAHTACLKNLGYTMAYLASGVDICYPKEHRELYEAIIINGAVISEYKPGVKPNKRYFPRRNRLIAACCNKLLVAEVGEKSGALITAQYAKKFGKKIYAVPNNIYSIESNRCNKLISEGAKIYLNPQQLVMESIESEIEVKHEFQIDEVEKKENPTEIIILKILKDKKLTLDELEYRAKLNKSEIINILFKLEIEEKVKCVRGRYSRIYF